MSKKVTYGSTDFEVNRIKHKSIKALPFWKRRKCEHHLLYLTNGYRGYQKLWVCEKCGHLERY